MESGVKERLKQFIEIKGVTTARFEALCGLGNSYISKLKSSIGSEKIVDILRVYPDLDVYWLITGVHSADNQRVNQQVTGDGNTQVAGNGNQVGIANEAITVLKNQLEVKDGQIERLLNLLEKSSK